VSLVPSQTELLFHLGLDECVVGITKFCIHPMAWKKSKTIIGGTKTIQQEKVKALRPDLIIANKEENVKEQVEELAKEFTVLVTDVNNLESALQMIQTVGTITQTELKAAQLADQIEKRFAGILTLPKKITTCYLIWRKPYMTVGGDTFIHDMLIRCGLQNIYAPAKRYPEINLNQLQEANTQLLILSSEPYPFKQKHIDKLQSQLPGTKIILANGEMFSWFGSRLLYAPAYFNTIISQLI